MKTFYGDHKLGNPGELLLALASLGAIGDSSGISQSHFTGLAFSMVGNVGKHNMGKADREPKVISTPLGKEDHMETLR